jgi:integrase
MAEDQSPEALVFHGTRPDMAIRVKPTLDALYEAMNAIGITPEARKKRFLDVHALRHTFVTCMRGQVPDFRLQRATGHRSTEMLERYTAAASQPEDFIQLRAAQDTLFPSPGAPAVQGLVDRLEGEVNVGTCLS